MDTSPISPAAPIRPGTSPAGNNSGPRQTVNRDNEGSSSEASTEKVLALFIWRGSWLCIFARARRACVWRDKRRREARASQLPLPLP